ncbi:unnamed protein product [Caenorhabditis angaria]|uniref:Glycosyltransferase family 92 protein n=1 Tax=Caenorhabditis angaria TaxID=860376 RepID=A0A9P1N4Q0_9PELO|nr:unnamed protein product [Caenorhabditis angaria]
MGCLLVISTIAHTICLVSELIFVKMKLRFTRTHRDDCYRSVIVYMFAMLFQSTLFLMMSIDLFLAVIMPIRHKLWRRGPYLLVLCIPPFAFSTFALFIEEIYINHDDLLICTVTLAAPPHIRFWGTLVTFCTIALAVIIIFITACRLHFKERESARRILRHCNSITSNTKCSDTKLLKSLSTLMFVFVCSWSASLLLSHIALYFDKTIGYEIQKYNILLSLPTFCQNFFVTGLRSPRYSAAYSEQLCLYFYIVINSAISSSIIDDNEKSITRPDVILRQKFKKPPENALKFYKLDDDGYAISTFLDERNGNMGYRFVRILMALKDKDVFECFINSEQSPEVRVYEFSENHRKKYGVFILNCKVSAKVTGDIKSIEIRRAASSNSDRLSLPIHHHILDEKNSQNLSKPISMSICVPVLYGNFYSVERIIEFMEYNIIQGVEKVNVYVEPKTLENQKLRKMLEYYRNSGHLEYTIFDLPFDPKYIWYYGQLITITDCLLKMTGTSKYTFFNDFDEFFVPSSNLKMLETLDKLFENPKTGAQRVSLKYIEIKDDKVPISIHNTQSGDQMETRFTKCVIRPEMVFEQGIHHTSRVIQDDYEIKNHDGSLLLVYHYKKQLSCCQKESLILDKFGNKLREKYNETFNNLFTI